MQKTGFTLIEMITVIAITSLIGVYTVAIHLDSLVRSEVTNERDTLVALVLLRARSAALANHNNVDQGIFIDTEDSAYVLFEGTIYTPQESSNIHIPFSTRTTNVNCSNTPTIIFERLSGNTLTGATECRLSNKDFSQVVTINPVGQINW